MAQWKYNMVRIKTCHIRMRLSICYEYMSSWIRLRKDTLIALENQLIVFIIVWSDYSNTQAGCLKH